MRNWELNRRPAQNDMTSTAVGQAVYATPRRKNMRVMAETNMHIVGSRHVKQKKNT